MENNGRINEILDKGVGILKKYLDPSKIFLFGSRAKGTASAGADIDIAVSAKRPDITKERKIREELEAVSGLYKIDVVYIPSVDKDFKKLIMKTGKVLYERRG